MTSIYDNTVCDVKRQMSKNPPLRSSTGRVNSRLRTKTHPFYYTDWEEVLKREWNKRAPPLSPLEWKKKHAKNMNADDCCEFLMGRRCGRRRRLLFRSGYYLTIQPDGSVKGTKQKDSPYGRLILIEWLIFLGVASPNDICFLEVVISSKSVVRLSIVESLERRGEGDRNVDLVWSLCTKHSLYIL